MTIGNISGILSRKIVENSPAILTGIGVAGVVVTAILAAKGAVKANNDIIDIEHSSGATLTPKEKIQITWKHFIPAAVVGTGTIVCVISAQSINSKRAAVLMSLYTIADRSLTEVKDKMREELGEGKARGIMDKIAEDRVNDFDPDEKLLQKIDMSGGEVSWCLDLYSGREFLSNTNQLMAAMNSINQECNEHMYASLNDWYGLVGLDYIPIGETVGWTSDNHLELELAYVPLKDGRPAIAVGFKRQPKENFYSAWG